MAVRTTGFGTCDGKEGGDMELDEGGKRFLPASPKKGGASTHLLGCTDDLQDEASPQVHVQKVGKFLWEKLRVAFPVSRGTPPLQTCLVLFASKMRRV